MLTEVLQRLGSTWPAMITAAVAMVAIYLAVIVATRVAGPRSLAQMSAFDFVATVAVGSITASVGLGSVPLADGLVAVTTLFVAQYVTGRLRHRRTLQGVIDNTPLLLLRDGAILEDHMRQARMTVEDLRSHLRRSNVDDLADVRAVVLETTGDVSVLYGTGDVGPLLQGVRGAEGHEGPTGQLSGG